MLVTKTKVVVLMCYKRLYIINDDTVLLSFMHSSTRHQTSIVQKAFQIRFVGAILFQHTSFTMLLFAGLAEENNLNLVAVC